ncbi:MAG: hypothetical protein GY865_20000 [candidate division Zixibacteria bacterium]|nr:hypothetical protein [candidate division Zixibacteria bacterium]
MISNRLSRITTFMIYIGTFLLSILSFFTTFNGMTILLDKQLAFIGSLGLQVVLLGIAWSLMRMRENKLTYVFAFGIAAAFSIFFSFVNFDTGLQEATRAHKTRGQYSQALQTALGDYSQSAKQASMKGRYQISRLEKLLELENENGWATIVDEGSKDDFIQSIIDGARATVLSWETSQGEKYRQGKGRGIITNYLETNLAQLDENLLIIDNYIESVDSLAMTLNGDLAVSSQVEIANSAWVRFPLNEVEVLTASAVDVPMPPNQADYVEKSINRQQAFMLVLNDLLEMNKLAIFALLLAIAIDLIIIIMAFAGSLFVGDVEHIFNKIKKETNRKINKISIDDPDALNETLQNNIKKYRQASEYGLDVSRLINEYKNAKKGHKITLNKTGEFGHGTETDNANEKGDKTYFETF